MKLTLEGIKEREAWEQAGIQLPGYDVEKAVALAKESPRWAHLGIGNIFRIFIGGIADGLLEQGLLDRGLTCIETFDYDVVDQIYDSYDCLGLSVILKSDGTRQMKVLGSMAEAVKAQFAVPESRKRLTEIFTCPDLQIVSFTITEKGYALKKADGTYFDFVRKELEGGPETAGHAMCVVAAMLYERYRAGARPLALVSMDNCSHNGALLRESVVTVAEEWQARGFVEEGFVAYVSDEDQVAFPWTMIDKITPRPSTDVANDLEAMGVESMQPVTTGRRTYIAPFINAEGPQYLVIEDHFPNGRPDLAKGNGVYLASRETVDLSERMKVTACLNPVHTATGPLGVVLGYDLFAKMLNQDARIMKMGRKLVYEESMPMLTDPVILSPEAFANELFEDRFPNEYLGDTNMRLCTDASMGMGVRFGITTRAYMEKKGSAAELTSLPLGIAGWFRYLMGVTDTGETYELAPDPYAKEIHEALAGVRIGEPESLTDQLRPYLSNENLFFVDMYKAGLGEKIEGYLRDMIRGFGAVSETIGREIG